MGASAGTMRRDVGSGKSRRIDAEIAKEKEESKTFKILLLGGSECGKSTIAKQMRILHLNGFSEIQLMEYKPTIHRNCVEGLDQLLRACDTFKYRHDVSAIEDIKRFREFARSIKTDNEDVLIPVVISRCMERTWQTAQVQAAYVRRFNFPLLDCAKHFLDNMARIGDSAYIPTTHDVLVCRLRTTGISELDFHHKRMHFLMVDVGGQRTERRKWIHCFDNVDMLLFVVAMSDYDQQDPEDTKQNRMLQNLEIFKTIMVSEVFRRASIVLFLNKHDIFLEKLKSSSLSKCFPNYRGDNSDEDASKYVQRTFSRYVSHKHRFFAFTTQATDTDHIDRVFSSAVSHIVNQNLRSTGLHV